MSYRIGVDIGGSFTDFAIFNESTGNLQALKVFSRPDLPGAEITTGLELLAERYSIAPDEITYFTHGTTVGINTVIQRKGIKLALFATAGFIDVLEVARLKVPNMYDLSSQRPKPLIPRERVFGIRERMDENGNELKPVDRECVVESLLRARDLGCEGVIVSLLHCYKNPSHERIIREIAAETVPGMLMILSSEVWPIIREYERTITATISGYVQPSVEKYIDNLQKALVSLHVSANPRITKSNGGVMSAEQGKSDCIQMIFSGTAAGVVGAAFVAKTTGISKALSIDIGGTSADVSIILNGEPQYDVGEAIGDFNIYIPSVSVSSIGDGGGSVAWVDPLGVLKVGPESAGSLPGPACYGRGGLKPTVTDSFVACGLLGSEKIGYNAVNLDVQAAKKSIASLASALSEDIEVVGEAIQKICISGMYSGISNLISRFGIDPREFTMIALGGAGPMLGPLLARELGIQEVLIPMAPGVLSALGGLVADIKNDFIKTAYVTLGDEVISELSKSLQDLQERALQWLRVDQGYTGEAVVEVSADMRYKGQSFEIETPLEERDVASGNLSKLVEAFHHKHEELYGYRDVTSDIQLINLRLVIIGKAPRPQLREIEPATGEVTPSSKVRGWMDGAFHDMPVYRRTALKYGHELRGPAIIAQDDCTTVVPRSCLCTVDKFGNLRISIQKVSGEAMP